jgi:membrane protease YdiL (CAAX protease family)
MVTGIICSLHGVAGDDDADDAPRRVLDLIGPASLAWQQFWRVSLYLAPLYAFLTIPALFAPEVQQQFAVGAWLALLPTVLPLLFVQISAEELVFCGYLQSHLSALTRNPFIWIGVPSFLYGLIHYDPTSPAYTAWSYVIWASVLGVVCADITARSGTLGPAFAIHFINNFGAIVVLAADDWMYGAALYVWPMYGQSWEPWIPFDALFLLCVWLATRLALQR